MVAVISAPQKSGTTATPSLEKIKPPIIDPTRLGVLTWILVGLLAGWIASRLVGSSRGLIGKLIVA